MAEYPIVSIAEIQRRARRDHAAGRSLSECALPPHSPAYATYAAEYERLAAQAQIRTHSIEAGSFGGSRIGQASPSSYAVPIGRQRVDQAQGASPP